MMNLIEEAIIYATIMHQGKVRKFINNPFILHPMEVAQILSTLTDDPEIITAGILHDVVEETDGTLEEIKKRFGNRVALLVDSETEKKSENEDRSMTWKRRKEESLMVLKNSRDKGVKMLWLADKLSNIRSFTGLYLEQGEVFFESLHQPDPDMQRWYYQSIVEILEQDLSKTTAYREYINRLNTIWPGSVDTEMEKFKKYREVSVEGCKMLGHGAKGAVYRYDNELIIKVFNENNSFHDVEQEITLSRKAFILGIPTAISFGIVSVGTQYGAMYELLNAETISSCIARNPGQVKIYARIMANLARKIHSIDVSDDSSFPMVIDRLRAYVRGGVAYDDIELSERCLKLLDTLPERNTLVHGDFHTGNVFMKKGEPLLIDMDRLAKGHPYAELSDLCYYYVVLGEDDPSVVENFMGFSYQTALVFFQEFLRYYLESDDDLFITEVGLKLIFICYVRAINRLHKTEELSDVARESVNRYLRKVARLLDRLETLDF